MASMDGAPRVWSLNIMAPEAETDVDARPVLVPRGNKAKSAHAAARKPSPKPTRKADAAVGTPKKPVAAAADGAGAGKGSSPLLSTRWTQPSLRKHDMPVHLNILVNVSCSSEASVESLYGRPSDRRLEKKFSRYGVPRRGN
ncbi:hypothetical protein GUJ93_ZPchr0001g29531 [Zizania palustris]|uniref:Uncharacterized protein n=1 Tax=Zizania palustris TaxID=103762 RepID=A0A8J5S9D4_ZIZPA|nr:hypothetical protein GUJ93_ZPchr0001g29531 [Zizania palustris]